VLAGALAALDAAGLTAGLGDGEVAWFAQAPTRSAIAATLARVLFVSTLPRKLLSLAGSRLRAAAT
jgi:hypothetical protein